MQKNRVVLIQVWIGKLPDYFWLHYETTKNLPIDFLFFTDQELILDSPNYNVQKISLEQLQHLVSNKLGVNIIIKSPKKVCDLKASYGDLFTQYINDYEYFGCYDIDTFFGDVRKYLLPTLDGGYDFISVSDEVNYRRLAGPFLIMKNCEEIRTLYKNQEFVNCFNIPTVECYEEVVIDRIAKEKYNVKLISSFNIETYGSGKMVFDAVWYGNKVFVQNEEKLLYHFYFKNETILNKIGNVIYAKYKKQYEEDFYWVIHFSENYEKLVPYLIESLKKYSNRKCLLYMINYESKLLYKTQYSSDQFIFKRIDFEPGIIDYAGRDVTIMNSKPLILLDAIKSYPNKKFVHIDTDIYLTVNADSITKYFNSLTNYPLINSHIHEVVWLRNIVPGEEWSSPIHILLNQLGENIFPIFPRRKCNVIVFDEKCSWFFEEQMEIYNKYKDSGIPGILAIFDEDSANGLLAKYQLYDSLPVVDIEDSYVVSVEKFNDLSHPFHMTEISPSVRLPQHSNDILFFHNFKFEQDYLKIKEEYGKSTLDPEEFIISYSDNTLFFRTNTFFTNKKIEENVDFLVKDLEGNIVQMLSNQNLYNYWLFYISNIFLEKKSYIIEIVKTISREKIYNNIFKLN